MWKPRKRESLLSDDDSDRRSIARTVSSGQEDGSQRKKSKRCPSRTSSGDSTTSVQSLSVALQQSVGSTKSIQDWDKKMGLKVSHSSTMRKTSKSREQLLAFLQKQEQDDMMAMEEEATIPQTVAVDAKAESQAVIVVEL